MTSLALTPRPVADSADQLLDGVRHLGQFVPAEARSTARFERVEIDGRPGVVKYVHPDLDVFMRVSGDLGCIPRRVWAAGLMDTAPDVILNATIGVAPWGRNGWGAALLMEDMSAALVPPGDEPVDPETHLRFLDAIAALSASTWSPSPGALGPLDLLPQGERWGFFGSDRLQGEEHVGWPEAVPRIAIEGWQRFDSLVPGDVGEVVRSLARDPAPLAAALARTPLAFLHGDWKMGNLGVAPDGRVVLLDWTYCGIGPVAHELAWYLALNRARLPIGHTKESTIDDLQAALGRRGVDTATWWERQVELCLLGGLVEFGWEKVFGPPEELAWWVDAGRRGMAWL